MYLLCYVNYDSYRSQYTVETEKIDKFENAIRRYTLMCSTKDSVTLSNLTNEQIIKQFAKQERVHSVGMAIS